MKLRKSGLVVFATITVTVLFSTVPSNSEILVDETEMAVAERARIAKRYSNPERYDVTITPPVRPGSEPLASLGSDKMGDMMDPAASDPNASPQARHSIDGGWSTEKARPTQSKPASTPQGSKGTKAGASAAAVAATPVRAVYASARPAMQVGAYRQAASAEKLKQKLLKSFDDVYVTQVVSGGEPLYRVRVGLGSSHDDLTQLKTNLAKGGYSCFPVSEPRP
jgi:cell division septation protein DedD